MIFIEKKAEEKLLRALTVLREKRSNHRCLALKVPPFGKYDLAKVEQIIYIIIDDPEGRVFICEDNNIFIIAHGLSPKLIEDLEALLVDIMPPQMNIVLFELCADWLKIKNLAEKKLTEKNERKKIRDEKENMILKQKQKTKYFSIRNNVLNTPLDFHLIETISSRRDARNELEILIVEDDPFSRCLIKNALNDRFNVSLAENGREALIEYTIKAPDIMFLDIGLPDIDGHDVLTKILTIDPQAFVVMLSGKGSRGNVMRAIQNGAKGFIGKPFTKEKLLHYIYQCPKEKNNAETA